MYARQINAYCKNVTAIRRLPFKMNGMKNFSFYKNEKIFYIKLKEGNEIIAYWYSDIIHPKLPEDCSSMFQYCNRLKDISGLKDFNLKNTKILDFMFAGCSEITDLNSIGDWDTSNVSRLFGTFCSCENLEDLTPIGKWNLSNAIVMFSTFSNCCKIKDLTPIKNWDIKKVLYMNDIFAACPLANINNIYTKWSKNKNAEIELSRYLE